MTTHFTSREFNQDLARAKREALKGPVIVTDRGKPTHVLLSMAEYERRSRPSRNILEMLAHPASADIELPLPERTEYARVPDLSE